MVVTLTGKNGHPAARLVVEESVLAVEHVLILNQRMVARIVQVWDQLGRRKLVESSHVLLVN
jgi:hypothetical protein